jgi:amidase
MSELVFFSVTELAQGIRDRSFSTVEVLQAYLTQIAKHNSNLHAICTLDEERA